MKIQLIEPLYIISLFCVHVHVCMFEDQLMIKERETKADLDRILTCTVSQRHCRRVCHREL